VVLTSLREAGFIGVRPDQSAAGPAHSKVAPCSLLTAYCSLLTAHCLLLTAYSSVYYIHRHRTVDAADVAAFRGADGVGERVCADEA